jgi:hypothetical protein
MIERLFPHMFGLLWISTGCKVPSKKGEKYQKDNSDDEEK